MLTQTGKGWPIQIYKKTMTYACVHVCMCACVRVCVCACVHVFMCACVHVCMCDVINDCERKEAECQFLGKRKEKREKNELGYAERSVCVHGPRYSPSVRFGWHFRPLPSATPQLIS